MGISSTGSGRPFPLGPTPVPTRPPARGSPVLRALRMGSSEAALGRSAPLPARPRAGARLSLKQVGGKNTRAPPWTRVFMAARSHSLVFVVVISDTAEGQFPPIYQDRFGTYFQEKYAGKHFRERKFPNQGIDMGPGIVPQPPRCAPTSPKPSPWVNSE